jgi:phosphoribosyl 1,2-cyclic phosphodiesterase
MTLQLRFWGTRGSIPSPGPLTVRYGGNTPCVEVRTSTGRLIILDAGTGIRELGRSLMLRASGTASGGGLKADIFLTHAHWDHIQGIPFFAPIFQSGNHFTIWGSRTLETNIDRVVRDQMSPVVFPVSFEELSARIDFCELAEERRSGDGYEVTAFSVRHPGGALGYRFDEPGGAGRGGLVYISDNELGAGGKYDTPTGWKDRLVEFIRGARTLVHDATYTSAEYEQHRGWGHSTYDEAVGLALEAGVERLVLFHHKPERSDDELDRCVAGCRALAQERRGKLEIAAAAEGMTMTV